MDQLKTQARISSADASIIVFNNEIASLENNANSTQVGTCKDEIEGSETPWGHFKEGRIGRGAHYKLPSTIPPPGLQNNIWPTV